MQRPARTSASEGVGQPGPPGTAAGSTATPWPTQTQNMNMYVDTGTATQSGNHMNSCHLPNGQKIWLLKE